LSLTPSTVAYAAVNQMFAALGIVFDKAADHAKARNVDEAVYLNWRLAPDMFTMSRQVQIACDITTRGLARLAGSELPSFEDNETSFAALRERVAKAHAFIKALDRAKIDADLDGDALFFSRALVIEGNTEAVVSLRNALDDIDGSVAERVAAMFGPPGRATLAMLRRAGERARAREARA